MPNYTRADLVRRYESGESIEAIAKAFGVNYQAIRWHLVKAGVSMRSSRGMTDETMSKRSGKPIADVLDEIVRMYQSGVSLAKIGEAFGVTRPAVVKRLRERGIEFRTASEAAKMKFAMMSEEERRQITEAAHAAVRGVPRTFQDQCKIAIGKEVAGEFGSVLEIRMASMLADRGLRCLPQRAIGPYNVDLSIEETAIAVELFGGNWHNYGRTAEHYPERIKYIVNSGWDVVVIWCNDVVALGDGSADYLVALHESVRRGESGRRQERVIWGDGRLKPICKSDPRYRAIIVSD